MKIDGSTAPPTGWAHQRERSSPWQLRTMRRIAVTFGRRATRALLWVVVCGVVLNRSTRRDSKRYLDRVLGRPTRLRDVHAHVFAFLATVLDRVYLLQERFDDFEFSASGIETILEPVSRGEGVLAFGAHFGSFEALRMIGHDKGLRVAMIMYEDNARLIGEALAALAPKAELHTIALGRVDAMLSIKRWLDDGGLAGLLADRTLPVHSQRSKSIALPFLGSPAMFSDGPFRLAAMLRRKVVFMAGLYRGGRTYDLRFIELADFATLAGPGPGSSAARDLAIRAALERYVQTLEALCREAPFNWFNFYDFWAHAETPAAVSRPAS
jgi:predicted LPLAT superfamily acyltransferase